MRRAKGFPMSLSVRLPSRLALVALVGLFLAGCGAADRLKNVGAEPALSAIQDPTSQPGYRPVQMPMPATEPAVYSANSLWKTGSRTFFRDQRARQVGDILTVRVDITDRAEIANATERSRRSQENAGINAIAGYETRFGKILPDEVDPGNLVDVGSTASSGGSGSVDRSERVTTAVAAVITQVLPNGNLVIEGRQEVRVNFEVRELIVAGIVRPEDIAADNTIASEKIAEARIAYGGRGQITDVQQPRYGQQVLDVILPF